MDGAARAPDGAVGLKAAAKAELPQAVAALHANRVLHVGQNVPAGRPLIKMYLRAFLSQNLPACGPEQAPAQKLRKLTSFACPCIACPHEPINPTLNPNTCMPLEHRNASSDN